MEVNLVKVTYVNPEDKIDYAFKELKNLGVDVELFENKWELFKSSTKDLIVLRRKAFEILSELNEINIKKDFTYEASVGLAKLKKITGSYVPPNQSINKDELKNKIFGGWYGRIAGCLLGKPVEKMNREAINELLHYNNCWPLNDYFTGRNVPSKFLKKYPWNKYGGKESLKENIIAMPEDDDINFTMLNLYIIEKYGFDFTLDELATSWLESLPVLSLFTAERVAYLNVLNSVPVEKAGEYYNPYKEWIGAQIRADLWGWVSPGDPDRAVELAWRDAIFTHRNNGVYGALFVAAVLASSFVVNDPLEAIKIGLSRIPQESKLAEAIRFSLDLPNKTSIWEEAVNLLHNKYGDYNWVHTINNAALLVAAIIYSNNDYSKAITNVVMGGWDTDCNGATVGAIMGTLLGYDKINKKWIDPLQNRVRSSLKGFDNMNIDELAQRTINLI